MTWFHFVVLALAAFRLQRVVTTDSWPPSRWFRAQLDKHFGPDHWVTDLFSCGWCFGLYATIAVFAIDHFVHYRFLFLIFLTLAASAIVGLVSNYDAE